MSAALVCGFSLSSCKDDENEGARAVIASSRSIEFTEDASAISIDVTSDGNWHVEAPEWLTITPATGTTGRTEVTIETTSNKDDKGTLLPRKYTLQFISDASGRSLYTVTVRQAGNKFRDIRPSSIAQMEEMEEEAAVQFASLPVLAQTTKGFVGTDGTKFVYVTGDAAQARSGQLVDMLGTVMTSDTQLPYVVCDELSDIKSGTVPAVTATDITADIDNYKSDKRTYIKATGNFDGTKLIIADKTMGVQVEDNNSAYDMKKLAGHILTLTGVYSGTASPVVRMIVTEVEDLGANEVVYFQSDFKSDWAMFANWSNGKGDNMDSMGTNGGANKEDAPYLPNITTPKVDGITPLEILKEKGYILNGGGDLTGKGSGANFQKFYLKMGSTNKQNSLTLPSMPDLEDGVEDVRLSFIWCPYRKGSASEPGAYDTTEIVVVIKNGSSETQFAVDAAPVVDGKAYEWYPVEITFTGMKLDKDSRIEIRNIDSQYLPKGSVTGLFRWFLDDIKVYKPKN